MVMTEPQTVTSMNLPVIASGKSRPFVPLRLSLIRFSGDVLAMASAFFVSTYLAGHLADLLGTTPINMKYVEESDRDKAFLLLSGLMLFMFFSKGHYTNRIPWWTRVQFITSAVAFTLLIDGFISFAAELYFSRMLIALNWATVFVFLISIRTMVYATHKNADYWKIPTVIIGDPASVTDVLYALRSDSSTGYAPHAVFLRSRNIEEFDRENLPARYREVAIHEDRDDSESYIRSNPDKFYIVSLESFRGDKRDDIVRALHQSDARFAVIPSIGGVSLHDMEPRYFFGNDVMLLHSKTLRSPIGKLGKRAMDIVLSAIALFLLLPVFAIIALMLKLEGQGGSIFYGGKRLGQNGRHFECWKFRSMEPNSDHLLEELLARDPDAKHQWENYHKLSNDPRITTKTARFIRKASLDEIPQLWNVLKGDMSLVGPRPILPEEQIEYGNTIDAYLKTKPGITGLWQVSGRNAVTFQRRIYWDSWYVRNWSLWGDIVIILKTIPVVLMRSDAS